MPEKQQLPLAQSCNGNALTPQQLVFENSWLRTQLRLARSQITSDQQQLDLLQRQSQVDCLTQTPNRLILQDRAQQAFLQASRDHSSVLVVFIDIDHFKQINDNFGHSTGDQVLVQIAARLRQCLRSSDTVCRYGGDEFVLLLPLNFEHYKLQEMVDKLLHAASVPMTANAHLIVPEVSIGVAIFPQHGVELAGLIEKADQAMYAAKANGGHHYQISPSNGPDLPQPSHGRL
jgi:diguanylate cyclase (GGDEF)-like protein